SADGTPRAATFSFTPPGGSWDAADSGGYAVAVEPNRVADVAGNSVPAGAVGELRVYFPGIPQRFTVRTNSDDGPGSLRDAVALADAATGSADTIAFDPAVFDVPRTITLTTGQLAVTDSVTVAGPGAALLTVSGNNFSRIFLADG